jgi:hypothetical protein
MSGFLQSGGSSGGGSSTPTGPAGGDLGGTYPNPTVTDIQGNPVKAVTLGASQDGYVLTWVFADGKLEFLPSPSGTLYSHFFALMPGDNSATIAVGAPVLFPQNGPSTGAASSLGAGLFNLPAIGTYEISWQASIAEAGQLQLAIGGVGLPDTVVGRAALTSQIVGFAVITTTAVNSVLSVINPAGNSPALTLTPHAGGAAANPVSATLTIKFNVSGSGGVPGVPPTGPAFGDLSGNYPDPIVVGLQSHAISSTAPVSGNILEWNGSSWTPTAISGDVTINSTGVATVVSIAGGFKQNVTLINHASTPYVALATDNIIATDSTAGVITITLPASPSTGVTYQIKDRTGQAATFNVTVNGNGHNIDAAATFIISVAYGAITVVFNGTTWMIM